MKLRFTIQNILILTALVALPVAFYAPELRSLDKNARAVLVVSFVILAISLVSFTPVWVVLFWLRGRARQGLRIRAIDYVTVFLAFLSGLGIIVGIFAVMMMIVGK
jgi:hypothetical protein